MRKFFGSLALFFALLVAGTAAADPFYAVTNELGYKGTIWNITDGTGPWDTSTPRNADLYVVSGFGADDYNYLLSSWFSHSGSNVNNSFIQLAVDGHSSPWTATGGWDASRKVFTVNVTGSDTPYPWSRFWQPDNGVAWGVNFTEYEYSFVATFADTAIVKDGWYVNAASPVTLKGSFSGQFQVTSDVNKLPISNGDLYGFLIDFDKDWSIPSDDAEEYPKMTDVGTPVPEPASLLLLGTGLAAVGARLRRRRR